MNTQSAGSLNDAASVGGTITVDGSTVAADFAVTVSSGGGDVAATFTQNDTVGNGVDVVLVNTGSGVTLDFTSSGTYDAQGTSDYWSLTAAGGVVCKVLTLGDDQPINLGGSTDAVIQWVSASTNLAFTCAADSTLTFGAANFSYDVKFIGDTSTNYFVWFDLNGGTDAVGALIFDGTDLKLGDDDELIFGDASGGDWVIDWNNTTLQFIPKADSSPIIFGSSSLGVNFSIYGDTGTSIFEWNTDNDRIVLHSAASAYDTALQLDDHLGITFGTGANFGSTGDGDWQVWCSGATNNPLTFLPTTDDSKIVVGNTGATKNADLQWFTGGGSARGFFIDASSDLIYLTTANMRFDDNSKALFGTSADGSSVDAYIGYDGGNNELDIYAASIRMHGDVTIGTITSDTENLTVTGNLSVTGTFTHAGDYAPLSLSLDDDETLSFGDAADLSILWDATNLVIEPVANDTGSIVIGSTNCMDFKVCGATATRYVLIDTDDSASDLILRDFALVTTDGTTTFTIGPTTSNALAINGNSANKTIDIGHSYATDVVFHGATAGEDLEWNASGDLLHFLDGSVLGFGATADGTPDITFTWDSSGNDLLIDGANANTLIRIGATNAQDFHVDGNAADMVWGASEDMLVFHDDAFIGLGNAPDLVMGGTGTTALFTIAAGSTLQIADTNNAASRITFGTNSANGLDLYINTVSSGEDIIFDASNKALTFDGVDIMLSDNDVLQFGEGSGGDINITWTSAATCLDIEAKTEDTGVIRFGKTNAVDVAFYSKSATKLVTFDAGAADLILSDYNLQLLDNDFIELGASQDMIIGWTSGSTALTIEAATEDTGAIWFGKTNAVDTVFYSKTASNLVTFDISTADVIVDGWNLQMLDDTVLEFGTSQDISISWDKTNFNVEARAAGAGKIQFGKTNAVDTVFYSKTTAKLVTFDVSAADITVTSWNLQMLDNTKIEFGTSQDIYMSWISAKTALAFEASAQGTGVIQFGKTNAVDVVFYGHTATDLVTFDVSAGQVIFDSFDLIINDGDLIKFGDSGAEGTISSDGTNVNFVITTALDFGGTTNYTSVASNGTITTVGSAKLDLISTTPIIFEGTTANTNQQVLTIANPTAAQAVTIPDTSGTFEVASAATHDYGAASANWSMSTTEAGASYFTVTNASGASDATFPAVVPGKIFVVYNNSGQAVTFLVSGQAGSSVTNAKTVVCAMNATDVVEVSAEL